MISALLQNLFFSVTASDCPLPCTTFSTETRRTSGFDGSLGFAVTFQSTVEVNTENTLIKGAALILGVRKGRKLETFAESPKVFIHLFVKVTQTVMMTPTLIGIMSDVRFAICQKPKCQPFARNFQYFFLPRLGTLIPTVQT